MDKNNMLRTISANGGVIVCAIDSTGICAEMHRVHETAATASAALGRLLTGTALMGCMLKGEEESVTLKMNGGGCIGTLIAISDCEGNVRGSISEPKADMPLNPANGKLNVGGVVGTDGLLSVIKDLRLKEPYIGQVPLVSGEIAEDITSYYATSEQIPTVVALGVLVDTDLSIKAAGGYMLQLLPGASDEEITLIENNIAKMGAVSSMIERGMTPKDIAFAVLEGFDPQVLDESCAVYRCNCSRAKMERALTSLRQEELEELAAEDEVTELVCGYCNERYHFTPEQLLSLHDEEGAEEV